MNRVWRVLGDPLLLPTADGSLSGESVAVKELFAVTGHAIGAGNPERLRLAPPELRDAAAVAQLRAAGASVRGISRTDEFAFSLTGANEHHGAPPNPLAPGRLPGGSSSGSASAVALGEATIGLGTDTGGSIRVPAAYQGLFGLRTTHGAVSREGVLPLAPTFDTVGWMTRTPALLRAVGDVLLPPSTAAGGELFVMPALLDLATPEVADAIRAWLPAGIAVDSRPLPADWLPSFQALQAHEAWQTHGGWLESRLDTLGADVRARFERGHDVSEKEADAAKARCAEIREEVRVLVGERILVLPSAASVAPEPADGQASREATLRLTCIASLGGLPALSLPIGGGFPVGVSLVAAAGHDRHLLDLATPLTTS